MLILPRHKISGFFTGEKHPLNSGVWCHANDLKIVWGVAEVTAVTATLETGHGIASVAREADGVITISYSATFDALPAVFAVRLASSGAVASRLYTVASDGVAANRYRTTSKQSFLLFDSDGATLSNGTILFLAVGAQAATTNITDRSETTPLTSDALNRIVAVGNYENPSQIENTVYVLSVGYTTAGGGDAGDTMVSITNMGGAHSRTAAGTYTTAFDNAYLINPLFSLVTVIGDDTVPTCGYGVVTGDVENVDVRTTNAVNDTEVDRNYCVLTIGEMEVA